MERVPLRPVRLHRGDPGGRAEEAVQRQDQATVHQSQNLKLNTDLTDVYFSLKDAQTVATCTYTRHTFSYTSINGTLYE